jgi:prevent-host-death family protein
MAVKRIGISDLRVHLSAYLREVKNGEIINITDRGQAVAQLVPVPKTPEQRLAGLVAAGIADWNGKTLEPVKDKPQVRGTKTVADMIIEDRE